MAILERLAWTLSRIGAGLACAILVGMVGHILLEIVLRTFVDSSTYVLDEFVGYGVAACTFLSLGYALEHGSLIRVSLLIGRLEGRARRALETLCALATLFAVGVLIRFFWLGVSRNWERGRVSSSIAEVPMWIPEGLVLVGLGVFALQLVAYLVRQISNDPPPVADPDADDAGADVTASD